MSLVSCKRADRLAIGDVIGTSDHGRTVTRVTVLNGSVHVHWERATVSGGTVPGHSFYDVDDVVCVDTVGLS